MLRPTYLKIPPMLVRVHFESWGMKIDVNVCVVPEFERIIRVVMLSPVLVGERGLEGGRVRGSSCVLGRCGWGEACCRGG